uniref:Uncharacterized protein n=1 Tax=Lepeophtheirus salmonis TaxID=72036 RepID=A0A0K2T8M2_LEPSM
MVQKNLQQAYAEVSKCLEDPHRSSGFSLVKWGNKFCFKTYDVINS